MAPIAAVAAALLLIGACGATTRSPSASASTLSLSPSPSTPAEATAVPTPTATASLGGGTIAVTRVEGAGEDEAVRLYVVRADGSGLRSVLPDGVRLLGLGGIRWSPDGRSVVVTERRGDRYRPAIVDIESGAITRLKPPRGSSFESRFTRWSPDSGTVSLVTVDDESGAATGIELYDASTGALRRVAVTVPGQPTDLVEWSPDGTRLVAIWSSGSGRDHRGAVLVIDVATAEVRVTHGPSRQTPTEAQWSPDGRRIAFIVHTGGERGGDNALYLADAETGAAAPVDIAVPALNALSWSPDGSRIAFTHYDFRQEEPPAWLHVVEPSGAGLVHDDVLARIDYGDGQQPDVWAPDGSRLAYVGQPGGPGSGQPTQIRLFDLDGSAGRWLTDDDRLCSQVPRWSSDGSLIAFVSSGCFGEAASEGAPVGLFVMDADGGNRRLVLDGQVQESAWQPTP